MKKHFKLIDLDCANCAAKMEAAIKKLDGVHDATVSFMTQKLTLDADDTRFGLNAWYINSNRELPLLTTDYADDTRFDEILNEVVKVCKKVEPDCTIVR